MDPDSIATDIEVIVTDTSSGMTIQSNKNVVYKWPVYVDFQNLITYSTCILNTICKPSSLHGLNKSSKNIL